jgi:hypothetical protein
VVHCAGPAGDEEPPDEELDPPVVDVPPDAAPVGWERCVP